MLSDGTQVYKDEAPSDEIMAMAGIMVVAERETMRKVIKWAKLTGIEVLEESTWPGKVHSHRPRFWPADSGR
jgi:hypothetical protein